MASGGLISPKGKLVHPSLRIKPGKSKIYHTYSHENEPDSARHKARPSMPEIGRKELHLANSTSERFLPRKPIRIPPKTAPGLRPEPNTPEKAKELAVLSSEKAKLVTEIALLQQELRALKRSSPRREDLSSASKQDLDQVLAGVLHTSLKIKGHVDQYSKIFARMYKGMLLAEDFWEDFTELKRTLEASSGVRMRSPGAGRKSIKDPELEALFRRTFLALSGWKRVAT